MHTGKTGRLDSSLILPFLREFAVSDDPYHFPPELLDLLIDTIPLLCRSKADVLTFFRGCGVPESMAGDLQQRVKADRASITKYEITRTILTRMNEGGDGTLRCRRELLKRVTEFEDFSTCWPDDQLKAQGLVARVRGVVNVKDSFTRIRQERDSERQERMRERQAAMEATQRRREQREALRRRLAALTSMANRQQRGRAFEAVLNDLFAVDGLRVREAFTLRTEDGQVGEQIDGLIVLDGQPILVEAKWHGEPLTVNDVSRHLVRVYGRAGVHGLIVSASPFSGPAVEECRRALTQKVIFLAELQEIMLLLEDPSASLSAWLQAKQRAASVDREPLYFYPQMHASPEEGLA